MKAIIAKDFTGAHIILLDKHGDLRCYNRSTSELQIKRAMQQLHHTLCVDGEADLEFETLPAVTKLDNGKYYVAG